MKSGIKRGEREKKKKRSRSWKMKERKKNERMTGATRLREHGVWRRARNNHKLNSAMPPIKKSVCVK